MHNAQTFATYSFGLVLVECARFVKQFRITANACYYFPTKSHRRASTEAKYPRLCFKVPIRISSSPIRTISRCSIAKLRKFSETSKDFLDFSCGSGGFVAQKGLNLLLDCQNISYRKKSSKNALKCPKNVPWSLDRLKWDFT